MQFWYIFYEVALRICIFFFFFISPHVIKGQLISKANFQAEWIRFYYYATCFRSFFWRIWRHQKNLSKLVHHRTSNFDHQSLIFFSEIHYKCRYHSLHTSHARIEEDSNNFRSVIYNLGISEVVIFYKCKRYH